MKVIDPMPVDAPVSDGDSNDAGLDPSSDPAAAGSSRRSHLRWAAAGLAIGLAFLWVAWRLVDVTAAWDVLRRADLGWALAALAGGVAFMAVKSWRWMILLRHFIGAPYGLLHRSVYIGTAANLVIAHTGELLRATMIARREKAASSAVLATIAIERILDFVALLVLTAVALVIDPRVSPLLWSAGLISLAFIAAGLLVVLAFLKPRPLWRRWGSAVLGQLPPRPRRWIAHQLQRGVAGLGALREPATVIRCILLSVLQWSCIVGAVAASAWAVGAPIPVSGAIAVFVLTVIGLTLPSSPAQLGTTQLAFVVGFELVGAAAAPAFAASLVYTAAVVVMMMAVGAVCWMTAAWAPLATQKSK